VASDVETKLMSPSHCADLVSDYLPQGTSDKIGTTEIYGSIKVRALRKAAEPFSGYAQMIADSYAWFATEAFWTNECSRSFGDPVAGDEMDPACGDSSCSESDASNPPGSPGGG
jgi:hypothetical protein